MKKYKTFDCVQMKWDIQKKIANEFADIPDEEAHRIQSERIATNPILGPFLNKVRITRKKAKQKVG